MTRQTKYTRTICAALAMLLGGAALFSNCYSPVEPGITPFQPVWAAATHPPNPEEHGIFPDVLPGAINLEWYADITQPRRTSGYLIFRSTNDTIEHGTGLLRDRIQIAQIEPSNSIFEKLDTSYRDTTAQIGTTYYYQLQAYNRAATNILTYSKPTAVVDTAGILVDSIYFENVGGLTSVSPSDTINLPSSPQIFTWGDSQGGGQFQVIVERTDVPGVVWSSDAIPSFGNTLVASYGSSGITNAALDHKFQYRWRVKKLGPYGASSPWQTFIVR